jgi:hypothetical protein
MYRWTTIALAAPTIIAFFLPVPIVVTVLIFVVSLVAAFFVNRAI